MPISDPGYSCSAAGFPYYVLSLLTEFLSNARLAPPLTSAHEGWKAPVMGARAYRGPIRIPGLLFWPIHAWRNASGYFSENSRKDPRPVISQIKFRSCR